MNSLRGLAPPLDDLLINLLTYKRIFVGPWFDRLSGDDAEGREVLALIRRETHQEALGTVQALHHWNRLSPPMVPAGLAARWTRRRIMDDLLRAKESSTEVFLNAAVNAPTDELRRRMLALADTDREHAERLRCLMGARGRPDRGAQEPPAWDGAVGAAATRRHEGSLRRNMETDLEHLRASGIEPVRLILSDVAIRHLRDEGAVDMTRGLAFGLPVDIEFGWKGECYAIETRERVTLAELVTSGRTQGRVE